MSKFKKIPVFLILLPLFFCMHGGAENFGYLSFHDVSSAGIEVLVTEGLMFFFCLLFFRDVAIASLAVIFISIWYFFFGAFHDFIKSSSVLFFLQKYIVLLPFLLVISGFWIRFLFRKPMNHPKLYLYFNLTLLIFCAGDGIRLLSAKRPVPEMKNPLAFSAQPASKPDVYFILADSYPGEKSLSDSFNFSNKHFLSFLDGAGFKRLSAGSNYDYTVFSMASMLNMQYVAHGYSQPDLSQKDLQARQQEINTASVFSIFKKFDYRIINNSIFDINDQSGQADENDFLLVHTALLTDKILHRRLVRDLGHSLPNYITGRLPFLRSKSIYSHREDNLTALQNLEKILQTPHDKPVFCYTHFLMPHDPYYFDSSGREVPFDIIKTEESKANKSLFISYLKYSNSVFTDAIKKVRAARSGAIVIFMSDHGYRYYVRTEREQKERFDNVCAVHFPDGNYGDLQDTVSAVNFFRYLFNHEFGQSIKYLPVLRESVWQ